MKSKKLNLNELKVKSFVTNLENEKDNTIKGGYVLPVITCYSGLNGLTPYTNC